MVVLEHLGLRVRILIDGEPTEEYQDQAADLKVKSEEIECQPSLCHRYIESVANARFAISVDVVAADGPLKEWLDTDVNHIVLLASIDGIHVGGAQVVNRDRRTYIFKGVYSNNFDTLQEFQFSSIHPIEDAPKEVEERHKELFKQLGTIQIGAYRCKRTIPPESTSKSNECNTYNNHNKKHICSTQNNPASDQQRPALSSGTEISVAEKALKGRALNHGARLGPANNIEYRSSKPGKPDNHWKWIDFEGKPYATFNFTYRSKEALRQELIIPRSPSPQPSPSIGTPNINDLSMAEIRQLAQDRLSDIHSRKRRSDIKEEAKEMPRSVRPLKFVRTEDGRKAIDLTED